MSSSAVAAKAAPRSLNQIRNVAYVFCAWAGYMRGMRERRDNDQLWTEHQLQLRKQNAERYRAAVVAHEQAQRERSGGGDAAAAVPAIVPEELKSVYTDIAKSIH